MASLVVIADFEMLRNRRFGLGPCSESAVVHQLVLQAAPAALHGGIVVTVALAGHQGPEAEFLGHPVAHGRPIHRL